MDAIEETSAQPTARRHIELAMLTVKPYGCAFRSTISPLATVVQRSLEANVMTQSLRPLRHIITLLASLALFSSFCLAMPVAGSDIPQRVPATHLPVQPPAEKFASTEEAEKALALASDEDARIEAKLIADERACYPRFFTTWCLDKATEARHVALKKVRAIEIEARQFIRRTRANEHDKELLQRQSEEAQADAEQDKKNASSHQPRRVPSKEGLSTGVD